MMTQAELIARLAAGKRLGVVTDVDGTISALTVIRHEAFVTERAKQTLAALADHITLVAAVSGRDVPGLREIVGLEKADYVGNHGFDRWHEGTIHYEPGVEEHRPGLAAVLDALRPHLVPGMEIEDKYSTASVHYRATENPSEVGARLKPLVLDLAQQHDLAFFEGRNLFELKPPLPVHKGTAFARLIETYQLDAAVFLGDDVTDTDAMQTGRELREAGICQAFGVGVTSAHTPDIVVERADLMVEGIGGVEDFLDALLAAVREG